MMEVMCDTLVENISISYLCQRSGVSRKTFYRLFTSKADVILAMIDHTLLDFESYVPDPSVGPGEIHRFLAFWWDQKVLLDALAYNHASSLLLDRALRHILSENTEAIRQFGASDVNYTREMMLFYINGLLSVVVDWHASGYVRPLEDMCQIVRILMKKAPVFWTD